MILSSSFGTTAAWAGAFGTAQSVAGTSSLMAVDCTNAHDCVAVGTDAAATGGAVVPVVDGVPGTEQDVSGPSNASLSSIACVFGASDCVATGVLSDLVRITGGAPVSDGPIAGIRLAAVACPPASGACVGVGDTGGASRSGEFVPITSGAGGTPVSVPGTDSLSLVACSAVDDCVAIGADSNGAPLEVQITNGAVAAPPQSLGLGAGQHATGLACSAVDKCFAVGFDINAGTGLLVPITASGPGAVVAVAGLAQANGIACAPSGPACVIVGIDAATQADAAFVALDPTTGGVGTAEVDGDPASVNSATGFLGVGCSGPTTCFGVLASSVSLSNEGFVVPITLSAPAIAPTATITTPANGATYSIGDPSSPTFAFGCSPGPGSRSTITSCAGKVAGAAVHSGDPVDTSAAGGFTLTVTATDSAGLTATATSTYTITAAAQTISFPQVGPFANRHGPVDLTATATSGLAVTLTVLGGPCSLTGSTLTFSGPGSCDVEATQPGNASFSAATPVDRTIVLTPPVAASCTDASVSAFAGISKTFSLGCADDPSDAADPLTFFVSGPAHGTLSTSAPGVVTYTAASGFTGTDSFTFRAVNDADTSNTATITLKVAAPAGAPTVTINRPADGDSLPLGGPATYDFTCTAGTGGTLLPGQGGCAGIRNGGESVSSGDLISDLQHGTVGHAGKQTLTVTATDTDGQTTTVTRTYTVANTQTITFPPVGPFPHGHAPVKLTASASSGLPVTYAVVSGPCTVDSPRAMLAFTDSGSCVVAADQAGNASVAAAPTVNSTIVINPPTPPSCSAQSLSFPFGTAETITLVCSDAPGDPGDKFSYSIVAQAPHGRTAAVAPDGTVTYTPPDGYNGPDSFTFAATNAQGASSPATVSIVIAPEAPPASTSPPGVSGSPALGQTLSCTNGVWSGGTPQSYTYQWERDASAIPGATGTAYNVVAADPSHALACAVTATNFGGNATARSAGLVIPAPQATPPPPAVTPPTNAAPPAISGTASLGNSFSCSPGAWSGTQPLGFAYQWKRDGTAIAGATGATYGVVTGDVGHSLTCAVAASNAAGSASAQSQAVSIPFPSDVFKFAAQPRASKSGVITVALQAPGAGQFVAVATFLASGAASVAKTAKSSVVTYGKSSTAAKGSGSFALAIHPAKAAVSLLKKRRRLRVTVSITFTPTGGKPLTRTSSLTVKHA
ncbi:MAG: hypothetical protein QOH12_1461 [Solirubrobacteraceae bacterium]|jgi:hypothetical protein|nr:hypothetical protein [Solirubrobacteraceae bacterium]